MYHHHRFFTLLLLHVLIPGHLCFITITARTPKVVSVNTTTRPKPCISYCRKKIHGGLFSSAADDTTTTGTTNDSSSSACRQRRGPVLFQKVLKKASPTTTGSNSRNDASEDTAASSLEFLGSLVGWLQEEWELPKNIPVVYEKDCTTNDGAVITWSSSLSPNPIATALYVEVIAVYPKKDAFSSSSSTSSFPIMAMVVVSKHADATKAIAADLPPMLQNLFREAEQCIVKHLDRSLMDWITTTKTSSLQSSSYRQSSVATLENAKADIWNDFIETHNDGPVVSAANGAWDAKVIGKNGQDLHSDENETGGTTTSQPAERIPTTVPSSVTNNNNDYAVEAARRITQNRIDEDFAVQEAKRVVGTHSKKQEQQSRPDDVLSQRTKHKRDQTIMTSSSPNESSSAIQKEETIPMDYRQLRPPSLSSDALASRSFAHTISRPQEFIIQRRQKIIGGGQIGSKGQVATKPKKDSISGRPESGVPNGVLQKKSKPKRFPRLNIVSGEESLPCNPRNDEKIRLANEAMDEMVKAADDLSAEDLLGAVMQFGEEKKKEDTAGSEFVNGAFEKAKELLREQHRNREERLGQQTATTFAKETLTDIKFDNRFDEPPPPPPDSVEEELRRMFEAGENIANQRITRVGFDGDGGISPSAAVDTKMVNDLVSSNKEVSSYARALDDELVELEIRLNKSPNEMRDGLPQHPVFDVLSGPEVYDPNVDPRVAVNWPGAAPDSKTHVRLPRKLTEAVSQARFAAAVLSSLKESKSENGETLYFAGRRQLSAEKVGQMKAVVEEASGIGLIDDPLIFMAERARLQMVINELWKQPEERFREIASEYKDLLLSDNFVTLVKHRLSEMVDCDMDALRWDNSTLAAENRREREVLGGLVAYAQVLLKEVQALGAQLEAQQLEVIRSICKVAMDPSLQTEEDTAAALSDAVRDMCPMFDDAFVAYLKYAVAEEEARLARAGYLDDPDHTQWLYVLKIVQQGVYKEIARGISRYIDHIFYILRMETAQERRMLLSEIIDALPTMDVRPFVRTVESIAGALGDSARGEFDGYAPLGELTDQILQLQHDTKDLLPPERIAHMSRDADEWARRKRERLLEQRKVTKQRLKAAQNTEHLDDTIEAVGRQGEMERFD